MGMLVGKMAWNAVAESGHQAEGGLNPIRAQRMSIISLQAMGEV
jgi:hypothetical protein